MDGEVLPIYEHDPDFETREPIPFEGEAGERFDDVADRLKQLGYME
jgi:hypothetical protein